MAFHNAETGTSLHAVHAFTFANLTALNAGTGYTMTSADVGKIALEQTSGNFYICTAVSAGTPSWLPITNPIAVAAPQRTVITTGTGTYTTPTSPRSALYLRVRMVGGGAGGNGGGSSSSLGGSGGNTTFGSATANGGANGGPFYTGGSGGAAMTSWPSGWTGISLPGGAGGGSSNTALTVAGGMGGASAFGPGGASGPVSNNGISASSNTGGGGGGAGSGSSGSPDSGGGGGAGAYIDAIITNPSATYAYSIGSGGTAGTGGPLSGGAGGSGVIIIEAYFQ